MVLLSSTVLYGQEPPPVMSEAQAWNRLEAQLQIERRSYLIMWPGGEEGFQALKQHLEQYPTTVHRDEILYLEAIGLWNLYRYEEAAEAYARYLEACPDQPLSILAMTRHLQSLVRSDHPDQVVEVFERYRSRPAIDQRTPALVDAMVLQGNAALARQMLKAVIQASDSGVSPSRSISMLEAKLEHLEMIGKPLTEFQVKTWKTNQLVSPAAFKGQIFLMEFWATWCKPCVAQMHYLTKAYEQFHAEGFEILGINLDEELAILEPVMSQLGMNWPQYADEKKWSNQLVLQFKVHRIPFSLLVDREGIVRYVDVPPASLVRLVGELMPPAAEEPSP